MTERTLDKDILNQWVDKQQSTSDILDTRQTHLMQATLNQEPTLQIGDTLPKLWHWLYFPVMTNTNDLGPDGHPKLGRFLPPVALPRRQWAGSRLQFEQPLIIGENATKLSTVKSITLKQGQTGKLCFVLVEHIITQNNNVCVREEQDIVYREAAKPDDSPPKKIITPKDTDWQKTITPDPILLFRYSALTFNSHKIHYDRNYSHEVENYNGLVVHGPLTATLLLNLAQSNTSEKIKTYDFRAISPLTDTAPFLISGKKNNNQIKLWASHLDGQLAFQANAYYEDQTP